MARGRGPRLAKLTLHAHARVELRGRTYGESSVRTAVPWGQYVGLGARRCFSDAGHLLTL